MKMQKQQFYNIGSPNLIPPINNVLYENINSSLNFLGLDTNDFIHSRLTNNSISICFYNKEKLIQLLESRNKNIESWFSQFGNLNYQTLGNNILELTISNY